MALLQTASTRNLPSFMLTGQTDQPQDQQSGGMNIADMLGGYSAGLAGNLPQYQAAKNQTREVDMKEQAIKDAAEEKRQATYFIDSAAMLNQLSQGNIDGVLSIGTHRLQLLQNHKGVDPSDTQRLVMLAIGAKNGDAESAQRLAKELQANTALGQAYGVVPKPEAPKPIAGADIINGKVAMQGPNGAVNVIDTGMGDKVPEAMQVLRLRAADAGLKPGTPEYADFMQKGGSHVEDTTAFQKDQNRIVDLQNQLSKMDPKSPQYAQTKTLIDQLQQHIAENPDSQKPPTGYKWKADGSLEPIAGGPADLNKQVPLGAREQVFLKRIATSANEAAKDLENVTMLPMSSSTGLLGGRKQGPSLFDATKEVLANKMTGQDAQSYNVMSAGFQRSLAAIEAAGLAPGGALTHQMDSVIFKEGDTNLTKLQKLAQTRQIIEAGLETALSDSRIPKSERDHIEGVMSSIQKAIPFTQKDLMHLQVLQEKDPKTTLKSVISRIAPQGQDSNANDPLGILNK